jgi:hypothetical protein
MQAARDTALTYFQVRRVVVPAGLIRVVPMPSIMLRLNRVVPKPVMARMA